MIPESKKIWMDGKLVDWKDAKVHFLTHSLHYGTAVFEGIRFYEMPKGRAIFRVEDHVKRFLDSAKIIEMRVPYTKEKLVGGIKELIKANGLKSGYVRPLLYYGYGIMGINPSDAPVNCGIACWSWDAYMGEATEKGARVKISSFTRQHPNITMTKAKISGNYVNSMLASMEAKELGFDEALMLDTEGYVIEGPGENFFIVRDKKLLTPPDKSILLGITRDTLMTVASDLGIKIEEEDISRDMLYSADEAFFCGTATELTPIVEVDERRIGEGKPGPITVKLKDMYSRITHGKEKKYLHWLEFA